MPSPLILILHSQNGIKIDISAKFTILSQYLNKHLTVIYLNYTIL